MAKKQMIRSSQKIVADLIVHYYLEVVLNIVVDTGRARESITITFDNPSNTFPAEGEYGLPDLPSADDILKEMSSRGTTRVYVTSKLEYVADIEWRDATFTLAWNDLIRYAKKKYPKIFK